MKKICVFLVICVLAVSCFGVVGRATDYTESGAASTNVNLTVPEGTYTVTIPASVEFGSLQKTEISTVATQPLNISIAYTGAAAPVSVKLANTANNFLLSSTYGSIPYEIYNAGTGGTALSINDYFAEFTANNTVTGRIQLDRINLAAAGSYLDTIVFDIE